MTKKQNIIGLYHENCRDGTTAAALLLKKYPTISLFPLPRGYNKKDIASILKAVQRGSIVYIVDFDLYEPDIAHISRHAKRIINIDHHIGAKEKLKYFQKKYKNFTLVFDNNRSGASLTWIHFWGASTMPQLIKYVEAGDIGKQKFGEKTDYVGALITRHMNQPYEVKRLLDIPMANILREGRLLADFMYYLANLYLQKAEPIMLKIGKYNVVSYNLTFNSEQLRTMTGTMLCKKHGQTVALFRIFGNEVAFSFRTRGNTRPHSLELAKILGGSGHVKAAGAQVPLKTFLKMIIV